MGEFIIQYLKLVVLRGRHPINPTIYIYLWMDTVGGKRIIGKFMVPDILPPTVGGGILFTRIANGKDRCVSQYYFLKWLNLKQLDS